MSGGRTWESALSVGGLAAIRAVGFEPVGQVFGAAVYYLATVAGVSCQGTTAAGHPLAGHGIAGATLRVTEIPATSFTAAAIEFTVTGTAVRAGGCPPLARPFSSDLPGPDFAKLVMAQAR